MEWVPLSVSLLALLAAGLAHREATRSSSRKQVRTVNELLEDLERFRSKLSREWEEERDRLVKQARRTGAAVRRFEEIIEDGGDDAGSEDADVPGGDARGGQAGGVPPMRQNVAALPWRGGRTG